MRSALIQRLVLDGNELDMGLFRTLSYVETLDLSGPRLLLQATDSDRILRDDFGVVEGAIIAAQLDDSDMGGSLTVSEAFVVKAVDCDANDNLSIQCLAAPVDALKAPAESALFQTLKGPGEILTAATGLPVDVGNFMLVDAWHLLPGERTSKKLRMLARELGAAVWYARGTLNLHPLRALWGQEPVHTLHYDGGLDSRRGRNNQINDWRLTYRRNVVNDRVQRSYSGWSMTEGQMGGGSRLEVTQYHQRATLDNLNLATVPAIDLMLNGQGHWRPGQRIELKFHRARQGRPFDESIPAVVMINTIASQQEKDQYRTRIKGVILNE